MGFYSRKVELDKSRIVNQVGDKRA
jgi:hypothetical protein